MRPFRHISCYRISVPPAEADIVRIVKALESLRFEPCAYEQLSALGFEPWIEGDSQLWVKAETAGLLCRVKIQRKVAPPSLVADQLEAEVKMQESGGRILTATERASLKSEIALRLSQKALPSSKIIPVMFNEKTGKLWIDTINARQQEQILALFGKAFPNTQITPDLVIPNLPELLKDLVVSRNADLPDGFRFLGDNRVQVPGAGVRSGTPGELSRLAAGNDLRVVYLSMNCSGLQFRWHVDGSISHIEATQGKDRLTRDIDFITQSISDWIKRNVEYSPNDHQKA